MNRLIAQVAVPVFAHLLTVELRAFEIVRVAHLEHVLEVAVEVHVHLHAVYVLDRQIITVSWWIHNCAPNLLPYEALGSGDMWLLVIAIYTIWINLSVATFEATIFLSHPVVVSEGLQVCLSSTLAWYSSSTSATMT